MSSQAGPRLNAAAPRGTGVLCGDYERVSTTREGAFAQRAVLRLHPNGFRHHEPVPAQEDAVPGTPELTAQRYVIRSCRYRPPRGWWPRLPGGRRAEAEARPGLRHAPGSWGTPPRLRAAVSSSVKCRCGHSGQEEGYCPEGSAGEPSGQYPSSCLVPIAFQEPQDFPMGSWVLIQTSKPKARMMLPPRPQRGPCEQMPLQGAGTLGVCFS